MLRLASASLVMVCLATVACDPKTDASGSASAAAPGKSGQAAAPGGGGAKGGDPAVLAELAKVKGCKFNNDDGWDGECKADEAFGEFRTKFIGEDDAKAKKVVDSCIAGLDDGDVAVRASAASCVNGNYDLTEAQKDALLAKLESEAAWAIKGDIAEAVDKPTAKQAEKLVALGKKWKSEPKAVSTLQGVVRALTPKDGEPSKDAVDLALELAGIEDASNLMADALQLAAKSPSRAADTCKKAAEIAKAGKAGWFLAAQIAGNMKDACKAELGTFVDAYVAAMASPNSVGNELTGLKQFLKNESLTKEQKDKIAKAAEELAKNGKSDSVKKGAAEVAEIAKK